MKKFLLAITALFFANTLSAATVEVEMLNRLEKESMVYSKSIVNIQSGDTVKWLAKNMGMIAVVVVDNNLDNLEEISSSKVAGKSKGRLAKIIDTLNS